MERKILEERIAADTGEMNMTASRERKEAEEGLQQTVLAAEGVEENDHEANIV